LLNSKILITMTHDHRLMAVSGFLKSWTPADIFLWRMRGAIFNIYIFYPIYNIIWKVLPLCRYGQFSKAIYLGIHCRWAKSIKWKITTIHTSQNNTICNMESVYDPHARCTVCAITKYVIFYKFLVFLKVFYSGLFLDIINII